MPLKITTRNRQYDTVMLRDVGIGDVFFLDACSADWQGRACMRIEGLGGEHKFVRLDDGTIHSMGPAREVVMLKGELSVHPAQDDPS